MSALPAIAGNPCRSCGATTPARLRNGLCAACLIALALQGDADENSADSPCPDGATIQSAPTTRRVGRYELLEELDHGGVGVVYRAWQPDLKREVALKMLAAQRLDTTEARQRFLREAELMAGIDHPGILPVYEAGEQDGVPWYAMKLAHGGNLAGRIADFRGRHRQAAQLVAGLARAVAAAHAHGVIHRDLKPANVVFDPDDRAMVADFGLARRLAPDPSLTGFDALIGTPHYAAPEAVTTSADRLTPAVDVYGLGAILYELLCGQAPFAELAPVQLLRQIGGRKPVSPRQACASVPPALEAICLRCLEKRPGDRYVSADALADALERWLAHAEPGRLARLSWLNFGLPSRRRRVLYAAAFLTLATAAGAGTWRVVHDPIGVPDAALATRTVAVLPVDPRTATTAEWNAARQVARHLRLPPALHLLDYDTTAARVQRNGFPPGATDAGARLGAFLRVDVVALPGTARFALRARDVLRDERLYEATFAPSEAAAAAQPLARALAQRRQHPTPEARLPRRALAALLRSERLSGAASSPGGDAIIKSLQEAIIRAPDSALAHARLAQAYGSHGGEEFWGNSAIEEAARAQRMDPTLGLAALELGRAYYFKNWFSRAATAYGQARALGNVDADYWLGLLDHQVGRFADSYQLYREVQRFRPNEPWPEVLLAHLLLTVGEADAGEHAMRRVIAREPDFRLRRMREAEIALYRSDAPRCRALAGTIEPDTSDGLFSAAGIMRACAVQQGDFLAALATIPATSAAYAKEAGSPIGNPPALQEAILQAQLSRPARAAPLLQQARPALQAAVDSANEYPRVWLRLAAAQRLAGETDAAYATLAHAFDLGLTVNHRNRSDLEFLPFRDDARFAPLRARSEAYVAAQRRKLAAQE